MEKLVGKVSSAAAFCRVGVIRVRYARDGDTLVGLVCVLVGTLYLPYMALLNVACL